MFCTNCGAKLKEGARFCIYCGQPVDGGQPQKPLDEQPAQPIPQQPQKPLDEQPTQPIPQQPQKPLDEQPAQPIPQQHQKPLDEQPVWSQLQPAWQQPAEPDEEEPQGKRHRLLPLWIALAVVALAAIAILVIQFLPLGEQADSGRDRDSDRAAASSSVSAADESREEPDSQSAAADDKTEAGAADDTTADDTTAEDAVGDSAGTAENGAGFVPSQLQTDTIIAQGWRYFNHRFDYQLAVPEGFAASEESQNGDGIQLYNEEQDMLITVYGGYQMDESTEELFDQACAEIPGTLGYHVSGEDWYAVSSEDEDGMVHYRKYGAWDDKYRVMELVYPKANEDVCDQLTEQLEDGFVSGTSY